MNSGYCPHNLPVTNCSKCNPYPGPIYSRSTPPELDTAISNLEALMLGSEPHSPYEARLTALVLVIARTVRHHLQQI